MSGKNRQHMAQFRKLGRCEHQLRLKSKKSLTRWTPGKKSSESHTELTGAKTLPSSLDLNCLCYPLNGCGNFNGLENLFLG